MSEFAGISGLDKATLMLANSDYASLRLRIRIPDGSPEEMFTFNIAFVQDTATANMIERQSAEYEARAKALNI